MIVHEHGEDALVLFDKESRGAMRRFLESAGQARADAPHAVQLRFSTFMFAPLLTLRDLFKSKSDNPFDQIRRNWIRKRETERALAELAVRQLLLQRRDDRFVYRIERVVILPPGEVDDM